MSTPPRVDAIVVGAGPSGLVAAIRLRQLGFSLHILDEAIAPAQESRAALMHASTVEILDDIGVGPDIVGHGVRITAITLADRDRALARIPFDGLDSAYPFALGIPQNETEAILAARLERLGCRVIRGVRIESVTQHGPDCRVAGRHLGTGESWEATASYVVGADGKNSTVRSQAGIAFDGARYDEDFILADVRLASRLADDEARITLSPDGVTVLGLLPSGRHRIVATAPRGRPTPSEPDRDYLDELLRTRGIPATTAEDPAWSSRFRISHRIARSFRAGNVLLCGDAAHVHSPAAGQGMNTGIADAYELARSLAAARAGEAGALDDYGRLRRRAAHEVVELTDRITRLALVRAPASRALRNAGIRLLSRLPQARRALVRSVAGLARSPLRRPL